MKIAVPAVALLSLLAASCGGPPSGERSYQCGPVDVTADFKGDTATLQSGGDTTEFKRVESADGTKYEAVGDPTTTLIVDGDTAILTIGGVGYPECVQP